MLRWLATIKSRVIGIVDSHHWPERQKEQQNEVKSIVFCVGRFGNIYKELQAMTNIFATAKRAYTHAQTLAKGNNTPYTVIVSLDSAGDYAVIPSDQGCPFRWRVLHSFNRPMRVWHALL